jgi:hypothetical protein
MATHDEVPPDDRSRVPTATPETPDIAGTPPPDDLPERTGALGSEGGAEGIELASRTAARRGIGRRTGSRGF